MAVLRHNCSCVWFGKSCAKASQVCTRNSAHKGLTHGALFSLLAKKKWYRWKHEPARERNQSLKMMFLQKKILIIVLWFSPAKSWCSTRVLMCQCHLRCFGTPDTFIRLQETCTPLAVVQLGLGRLNWYKMSYVYLVDLCIHPLPAEYPVVVVRTRQRTEKGSSHYVFLERTVC